jgi:hypothetical protein
MKDEIIIGPEEYPATVIEVIPLDNYKLRIKLSDGRVGLFDVSPYIKSDFFKELKDPVYFRRVYIDYNTVVWPHEQDIAPETIAEELLEEHHYVRKPKLKTSKKVQPV